MGLKADRDNALVKGYLDALSERERRLVELLAGGEWNQTRAMIRAGYSKSTAFKQQRRVCERTRVKRARIAIKYVSEGAYWLTNDELTMIGLNPRSVRQKERRRTEKESAANARRTVAGILARLR